MIDNDIRKQLLPRCAGCGAPFKPNPKLAGRQRYCSRKQCRKASKQESSRKWGKKASGQGYFSGPEHTSRVRDWRAVHPNYWKRRATPISGPPEADMVDLATVLQAHGLQDSLGALQDSIRPEVVAIVGLIVRLAGCTLQDQIAMELSEVMLVGQSVLDGRAAPGEGGGQPSSGDEEMPPDE